MEKEIDVLAEISATLDRIAVALESLVNDTARCGHGATGFCMACVIQHDLMRPPATRAGR